MNYVFLDTNFSCKLQGKFWKDDVLSVTDSKSERNYWMVYKIQAKRSFGHQLEGKSMPSKMVSNTNHTTLMKKSKCHKISSSQIWVVK